jgi:hypothetical protein
VAANIDAHPALHFDRGQHFNLHDCAWKLVSPPVTEYDRDVGKVAAASARERRSRLLQLALGMFEAV